MSFGVKMNVDMKILLVSGIIIVKKMLNDVFSARNLKCYTHQKAEQNHLNTSLFITFYKNSFFSHRGASRCT